jgi:hypothetical protein
VTLPTTVGDTRPGGPAQAPELERHVVAVAELQTMFEPPGAVTVTTTSLWIAAAPEPPGRHGVLTHADTGTTFTVTAAELPRAGSLKVSVMPAVPVTDGNRAGGAPNGPHSVVCAIRSVDGQAAGVNDSDTLGPVATVTVTTANSSEPPAPCTVTVIPRGRSPRR